MAAADRIVGTNVVVTFLPDGGSTTHTITPDYTSFNWNRTVDVVDVTAGNELDRYEKDTIEGLDFTLNMFDSDPAFQTAIKPRASGVLTIYKEGQGTGKAVIQFNALFKGLSESSPFDGALEIEYTGSRRGAMILDVGSVQA